MNAKGSQPMAKKPKVDTEPDDAFAAVLGEIDSSPLMRTPDGPASPASEKKTGKQRSKPKKTQNSPTSPNPKDTPRKKNRTSHPVQDKAPNQAPDQSMDQTAPETGAGQENDAASGVWSVRREDGCVVVSPPLAPADEMGEEPKAETPAQLHSLLLELLDKDTPCFRIDLTRTPHLDASSLAVLLSFATLLGQRREGRRLEIAARGDLAQFLCLCKVEETHPITLVGE